MNLTLTRVVFECAELAILFKAPEFNFNKSCI